MAGVPYVFASATTSIPLSQLDADFNTPVTIGNTSVGLGNTVTSFGNVTLTNATISGNLTATSITGGTANGVVYLSSGNIVAANPSVLSFTGTNLGIGTSNPTQALSVSGNGVINGASGNTLELNKTGGAALYFTYAGSASDALIQGGGNGSVQFWTGNSLVKQMTLDISGNLLVGTTSTPNASFACKSNFIGLQTTNPADSTKWRQIVFSNNSTDATLYFPNGSNTATLTSAGAWTNASDSRQKTNIVDIKYGLNTVLTVQPHSYNRTDVSGDFIGFVAQELKTIIPEVVFGSEETSYSVDYGSLVAVAFKAIQDLNTIITAQATEIAALKAKVGI